MQTAVEIGCGAWVPPDPCIKRIVQVWSTRSWIIRVSFPRSLGLAVVGFFSLEGVSLQFRNSEAIKEMAAKIQLLAPGNTYSYSIAVSVEWREI